MQLQKNSVILRKVIAKHGLTPEQFQMQIKTVYFGDAC